MLLHSKEYCAEVYPALDVWSYEDLGLCCIWNCGEGKRREEVGGNASGEGCVVSY